MAFAASARSDAQNPKLSWPPRSEGDDQDLLCISKLFPGTLRSRQLLSRPGWVRWSRGGRNGIALLSVLGRRQRQQHAIGMWSNELSGVFPDVDFHVSGTTEHEDFEYWVVRAGVLKPIDIYSAVVSRKSSAIVFCRDGEELTPPEFEGDMLDYRGDPVQITAEKLAEFCENHYRHFLGNEYPGERAALLQAAKEFVNSCLGYTNRPARRS